MENRVEIAALSLFGLLLGGLIGRVLVERNTRKNTGKVNMQYLRQTNDIWKEVENG